MQILLLGKNGQLGWELNRSLATLGQIIALDYPQIDLLDINPLCRLISETKPNVVINAAAYTQVDNAETEPDRAHAINKTAPGRIAEVCERISAAMIHYSTDYIFDGKKGSPYKETDIPNPLNVYGHSKLGGELQVAAISTSYWIFRTSWVYSMRGSSFVSKVIHWARQYPSLRIASDQVGNPTWARMLAEITAQLLARGNENPTDWIRENKGLYHLAGDGFTSRINWAKAILRSDPHREQHIFSEILPASTLDFSDIAARPHISALNCDHFYSVFGLKLPPWELALKLALTEEATQSI